MVVGVYVFNSDDNKDEGFHFCCRRRKVKRRWIALEFGFWRETNLNREGLMWAYVP